LAPFCCCGPPNPPPKVPVLLGPALGIEPVCAWRRWRASAPSGRPVPRPARPRRRPGRPFERRDARGEEHVGEGERGEYEERLEHLGQERQADECAAERDPADRVLALGGAERCVRRPDQQQHQQRVRLVEPEHQHRDRGQREDRAGEQSGGRTARRTPDRGVQQPHRRDALQGLGHEDAPARRSTGTGDRSSTRAAPAGWFPGSSAVCRGRSMKGEVVMPSRSSAALSSASRRVVSGL
jgi:hypothetical protein